MKKSFLKVVLLMALIFNPGCGSNNNEAVDGGGGVTTDTTTNTVIGAGDFTPEGLTTCRSDINDLNALRIAIAQGDFRQQFYSVDYYHMQSGTVSVNQSSKDLLWGLISISSSRINWNTTDDFIRASYQNGSINHEEGSSKTALKNYMIDDILANAVAYRNYKQYSYYSQYYAYYHEVMHANGNIYGFQLCYPIAANPVFMFDKDTEETTRLKYIQSGF